MNTWLWALQIFWNLVSVLIMAWIWFHYRRALRYPQLSEASILGEPAAAEAQTTAKACAALQREMEQYREKIAVELKRLSQICEKAQEIIEKAQHRVVAFPPSQEEAELALVAAPEAALIRKDAPIPTLEQVEKAKQRLNAELTIDLKSLLKDQLA